MSRCSPGKRRCAVGEIVQRILARPSALFFGLAFITIGIVGMAIDVTDADHLSGLAQASFTAIGAAALSSLLVRALRRPT